MRDPNMRLLISSVLLLGATNVRASTPTRRQSPIDHSAQYTVPPGSPGFYHGNSTAGVTFDQHSLFVGGKRVMIYSGEYHPWRQPSGPVLWKDTLQKFKAAGFNGVSIYLHWGLTEPKQGTLDWTYYRSLPDFYKVAQDVGIYVIVRPGPYINAETNAGGFPGWLTNVPARARTNETGFTEAWTPYITGVAKYTAPYQYPDGPVIAVQSENEFFSGTTTSPHMVLIENVLRANGITKVPLTHNDANPRGNFAKGLGFVDLYGFDGYPLGFDCSNPTVWKNVVTTYDTSHQTYNPSQPLYLPEFQGGAFDPWDGPGYGKCYDLINEQFANVFYKNNYAAGTTLLSLYMTYGGTNWGNLAEPTVYTSYDYGAPISEDRTLTPKYHEIKTQALFLHASPAYLTAVRLGNGTVGSGTPYSNSSAIYTTYLHDPESGSNFYVVRQTSNSNTSPVSFSLNVNVTSLGLGAVTVPKYGGSIELAGRESKVLVTDYKFGKHTLAWSTTEVLTWATIDSTDYIVLYAVKGQYVEVAIPSTSNPSRTGSSTISAKRLNDTALISGTTSGISVVSVGSNLKVLVVDKATALTFWAPRISGNGADPYATGPDTPSVIVWGPYLVRNATFSGSTLSLTGDVTEAGDINFIAPSSVKTLKWNGATRSVSTSTTLGGAKTANLTFKYKGLESKIPSLKSADVWSCVDSLPEIGADYDDSDWVVANKTSTARPQKPLAGKYVLYADEYGYHQGNFVFRGHFNGTNATGISLNVQGGYNFGYSAWLNTKFLGSNQGTAALSGGHDLVNNTFSFNASDLLAGDNVVTVVLDSTGLDEDYDATDTFKSPRGIRGYELQGADFTVWKVAGNFGGEDAPDRVRGPLNEGGLWAERVGAHLPGYSTSSWKTGCSPLQGISSAGIQAYRTTFSLDLPTTADIPIALNFTRTPESNYRSVVYINGWQFGRFTSNYGPQTLFPLPEGILNHRGKNELLVTLWSLDAQGAKVAALDLISTAVLESSKGFITTTVDSPTYSELRK